MRDNVDFYVLGNTRFINRSTGVDADINEVLGASVPGTVSELQSWVYQLDGGAVNANWRRENLSEVKTYGIPYIARVENFALRSQYEHSQETGDPIILNFITTRLFSKLNVTVDIASLTGSGVSYADYFKNPKIYVRGANTRLQPFGLTAMKALSPSDALAEGDFDISKSTAGSITYTLYTPENVQGTLLPSNTNNLLKNADYLASVGVSSDIINSLTYVEFVGDVNAAELYKGNTIYRFYPGVDATSDFSLERNHQYDITLSFRAGSLLNPAIPEWKLDKSIAPGGDVRFCLTSDAAFNNALPNNQDVVVRPGRAGVAYVYMNPVGVMGNNALLGKDLFNKNQSAANLTDYGWTSNFISKDNILADIPKLSELTTRGIGVSYNKTTGRLEFSVTNITNFTSHLGESVELQMTLMPVAGATPKTVNLKVLLYPDVELVWLRGNGITEGGKDLKTDFYPSQKRTLRLKGFYGDVQYRYRSSGGAAGKELRRAVGGPEYNITNNYASPGQTIAPNANPITARDLPLYNYYALDNYTFQIRAADSFNNPGPEYSFPVHTYMMYLQPDRVVDLDIAGNASTVQIDFLKQDKSALIDSEYIEKAVYKSILENVTIISEAEYYAKLNVVGSRLIPSSDIIADGYISAKALPTNDGDDYKRINIWRSKIADTYERYNGVPDEKVIFALFGYDGGGWCHWIDIRFRNLPLMNLFYDPAFTRVDDFTLYDDTYFDPAYKNKSEYTFYATAGCNLIINVDDWSTEEARPQYYAKPTNGGSYWYDLLGAPSQNIEMQQLSKGAPLKLRFLSRYDNDLHHSAGPHDVYVKVRNQHSGEEFEEKVGSFEVFPHILLGGVAHLDETHNNGFSSGTSYFTVSFRGMTLGDPRLLSAMSDNFERYFMVAKFATAECPRGTGWYPHDNALPGIMRDGVTYTPMTYEQYTTTPGVASIFGLQDGFDYDGIAPVYYMNFGDGINSYDPLNMPETLYDELFSDDPNRVLPYVYQNPFLGEIWSGLTDNPGLNTKTVPVGELKIVGGGEDTGYITLDRLIDVCPSTNGWASEYMKMITP